MAYEIVIAPATGAAANTTNMIDTATFTSVVVSAPGLATTEEVDIYTKTSGGYAVFGTVAAVIKLTATIQSVELPPGPVYAFAKDATAASVGVFINYGSGGS